MKHFVIAALMLLGLSGNALAQSPQPTSGMMCNTSGEVHAVLSHMQSGKTPQAAMAEVNQAVGKNACGMMMTIAFFLEDTGENLTGTDGKEYDIIKVGIVAIQNGPMMIGLGKPLIQFMIRDSKDVSA